MPNVVFLVHGMGHYHAPWSAELAQRLDQIAGRYAHFRDTPFSSQVEVAEITYGDAFTDRLRGWDQTADGLAAFADSQGGAGRIAGLVTWLRDVAEVEGIDTFFWSHCVDVLLYYFFPSVRANVRTVVMSQLVDRLNAARAVGPVSASVIAHSLGTAVAHDSLAQLATQAQGESHVYKAGQWQFQSIAMLANTSRVLQTEFPTESSNIRPGIKRNGDYCREYLNFRHLLDPFVMIRAFIGAWHAGFVNRDRLDHFRALDVHAATHYLDSPEVHVPVLNAIFGDAVVTLAEQEQARRDYRLLPPIPCAAAATRLEQRLRALVAGLPTDADPVTAAGALIRAGTAFLGYVDEAKRECV